MLNEKIIEEFSRLLGFIQEQINDALLKNNKKDVTKHSFRLRQIRAALAAIKRYDLEITEKTLKDVGTLRGIGAGSLKRIEEILINGKLSEIKGFVDKKGSRRTALKELQDVVGIGSSIAVDLVDKFNVKSVDDLIKKHKKGKIELSRPILLGLKYHGVYKKDIPRAEIDKIQEFLKGIISKLNKELEFNDKNKLCVQVTGSYRRGKQTSNDIDVLLTKYGTKTDNKKQDAKYVKILIDILKKPLKQNDNKPLLIDDMTDKNATFKYMGFCKYKKYPVRRMDIIFVAFESYYPALLYFTGSRELTLQMRKKAQDLGLKLNENELYDIRNKKRIKVNSEQDVFKHLQMDYLEPNKR
ncbi:DNA polymerase beta palm [seawater metagenome]|uniref:DNA-directed DNA polymerase n=1 Tax=seawater metagenome TaxID=1561972 RepID=A0A5E8CHY7_9ZZZZ